MKKALHMLLFIPLIAVDLTGYALANASSDMYKAAVGIPLICIAIAVVIVVVTVKVVGVKKTQDPTESDERKDNE